MAKNIIFCFDGTCNEPADAEQEKALFGMGGPKDNGITNVLKLHLLFGGDLRPGTTSRPQMSFYFSGVGTYGSRLEKLRNILFAPADEDVGDIIRRAIKTLFKHYEEGDQVFLFGFSRGSAIARRFAAVAPDILQAQGISKPVFRFMGVFDTVASINKPNLTRVEDKPGSDVIFENNTLSPAVEEALHLVSIDEHRVSFMPTLINEDKRVTEIWFPGAHADIGGGYRYDGLSDTTLEFMTEEIKRRQLGLTVLEPNQINYEELGDSEEIKITYEDLIIQPNYLGENHEQSARTHIKGAFLGPRTLRVLNNNIHGATEAIVHHTVIDRIYDDEDYYPESLGLENLKNPYTDNYSQFNVWISSDEKIKFNSLEELKRIGLRPLKTLSVGESKALRIYANQIFNHSGLLFKTGQEYLFTIDMNQTWFDSDIACSPAGWDRKQELGHIKSFIVKGYEHERRHSKAMWFAAIGTVNRTDEGNFEILKHTAPSTAYPVTVDGEFYTYANDLLTYYKNNMGWIGLEVKRLK